MHMLCKAPLSLYTCPILTSFSVMTLMQSLTTFSSDSCGTFSLVPLLVMNFGAMPVDWSSFFSNLNMYR